MPANFAVFFKLFLPHIFVEVLTNRTAVACTISAACCSCVGNQSGRHHMTEIKAVVFDFGCVLAHEHLESDLQEMADCLGLDLHVLRDAYWHHRHDYDAGISLSPLYFKQVAEKCGIHITQEQIQQCVDIDNKSWSRPIQEIVDWAIRLKEQGIKIAILSNMPQDFRDFLPNIEWLPEFHHATYSCELKTVKPYHDIYHHCLNGLGVQPENVLFIDDRIPNIEAAKELGWQGFVFTNANELHMFLADTNLPPVLI